MRGIFDVRKTRHRVFVRRLLLAVSVLTAANILERGGWSDVRLATAGEPSRAAVAVDSGRLRATVKPLAPRVLAPKLANPASIALVGKYYDSIRQWGEIVARRVEPVPGQPDASYLGKPRNVEDDVRPTCYAAMLLGFLSEYQPPGVEVAQADRERWRESAIRLLRYLTASHVTGGGACVNGQPWGNQWQSAMWARAAGMGGWFLWDHLDEELQLAVARLVEFEAERFTRQPPRAGLHDNTAAEENAWNAQITSLASHMMPSHPRAKAWEEAAIRYMYNSFSISADAEDDTPGDCGRPIKDWVTTVNAHDDFTVENHGLVHMGYLKNTASQLQETMVHPLIAGGEPPAAAMHHIPEVFELLIDCMGWDAGPVYFSGTDWKIYHEQTSEVVIYTMLSLLKSDRRAAFLQEKSLDVLLRHQKTEGGFYNVRRDLEYGGLCATRLIACCLAQGIVDSTPEPITADEFDRIAAGTRHLAEGRAVVHRTPNKFASFSWSQKRMALALPCDGTWVIWPHFASYLGIVDGKDSSNRHARLTRIDVDVQPNEFRVSGRLLRCKEKNVFRLVQDFHFASPPGDYTVYVERLKTADDFRLEARETGTIGLEYALGSNSRTLHGPWGARKTTGYGGEAVVHVLEGNWLNIDDHVGYVVLRSDGRTNLIRHHDESQGFGRVPQLQEWISLVGEAEPLDASTPVWTCVVTFLNQSAADTADSLNDVRFDVKDDVATCRIGDDVIRVDFSGFEGGRP